MTSLPGPAPGQGRAGPSGRGEWTPELLHAPGTHVGHPTDTPRPPAGPQLEATPRRSGGTPPAWRRLSVVLEEKLFVVDSLYL